MKMFFKTSWRLLEDVLKTLLQDVLKTSWKRLEEVLKTYGQDEYIGLDQDVFWRRKAKANIFVLIKTSSEDEDERRLHQDECLLGRAQHGHKERRDNLEILWYCWYFCLNLKFLEWPPGNTSKCHIKTSKMAACSEDFLCGDDFDAVLVILSSYRCGTKTCLVVNRVVAYEKDLCALKFV